VSHFFIVILRISRLESDVRISEHQSTVRIFS